MKRARLADRGALVGIVLGGVLAGALACGGAKKSAMAPTAAEPPPGGVAGADNMTRNDRHEEINKLVAAMDADLASMGLEATPQMAPACPTADCSPVAMGKGISPPTSDTTCKHGTSDKCQDSCRLADAICGNAKKICTIATELGNDVWANDKCVSGNASCDAAKKRCCGCQL